MIHFWTVGTSSAVPTPGRSLSAQLMNFRGERILFDCGEGTQRGIIENNLGLMKIDKIFITHWHADHFSGLLGLIQTFSMEDRDRKLEIYGPPRTKEFMDKLLSLGYFDRSYEIDVEEIEEDDEVEDQIKGKSYTITPFTTKHGIPSQGYVFQEAGDSKANKDKMEQLGLKPSPKIGKLKRGESVEVNGQMIKPEQVVEEVRGRKIVYTGDTEKIDNTVKFAQSADLLVHDATFNQQLINEGRYGHSSAREAALVAKEAGVRQLVLTHLSRRFDNQPQELLTEAKEVFNNVEIAEDGKCFDIEPYRPE